jgi:hypothetical protein
VTSGRALVSILFVSVAAALSGCATVTTGLRASGYYDTRDLATGTITVTATDAAHGTRLFAYVDLETNFPKVPRYGEAHLTQRIAGRLSVIAEHNRNFGAAAGLHRFGLSYLLPLPKSKAFSRDRFSVKYTPYSTQHRGGQLSISGTKLIGDDIIIDGYYDYNLKPDNVATDWQLARRIRGDVFAVVEYRHNGGRPDSRGVGIGLEWRIK